MSVRLETQILNELQTGLRKDKEVHHKTKEFANEVKDYWVEFEAPAPWNVRPETVVGHGDDWPYTTGEYALSIKVKQGRDARGRFISSWDVYTHSPIAHFIEYGTAPDYPGSRSPWGPNTPTYEYAPAARTAHFFGGTAD
jgi:hypothetical protein